MWGKKMCSARQLVNKMIVLNMMHGRYNIKINTLSSSQDKRLWWSRGSALPLNTPVCGFKPGWSRQDFRGWKILNAPSFGREVKPSVPCHRFMACRRFLNVVWKSTFMQNYRTIFLPTKFHLLLLGSLASNGCGDTWRREWERLKHKGGYRVAQ